MNAELIFPLILFSTLSIYVCYNLYTYARHQTPKSSFILSCCGMILSVLTLTLVPYDLSRTASPNSNGLAISWRVTYWLSFALSWVAFPTMTQYEKVHSIKRAFRRNIYWHILYAIIGIVALLYLWFHGDLGLSGIVGFIYAASNAWGLVLVTFLMGYGLVAIPQWLAVLAKDERLIQALYAQAVQGNDVIMERRFGENTARLKSKYELTDTFNACKNIPLSSMDVSAREKMRESAEFLGVYWNSRRSDDDSFHSISNGDEDPVEKEESGSPQGEALIPDNSSQLSRESIEVSMTKLEESLAEARRENHRWSDLVDKAVKVEDRMSRRSEMPDRQGRWETVKRYLFTVYDTVTFTLVRGVSGICAFLSGIIIIGQATQFWSWRWLSLLGVGYDRIAWVLGIAESEGLSPLKATTILQLAAGAPFLYVVGCSYWSLFKIKVSGAYGLYTHHHTDTISLLWCSSMVARLSFPLAYNYLRLLRIPDTDTTYGRLFGRPISAAPIIGDGFVTYFPLLVLVLAVLQLTNMYQKVITWLGLQDVLEFEDSGMKHDEAVVDEGQRLIKLERLKRDIPPVDLYGNIEEDDLRLQLSQSLLKEGTDSRT